ncbi:MAG: plastocyanin/azurin family copper-binding protein, partial [bacterium]
IRRRGFVAVAVCATFVASACGKDTKTADTGAAAPADQKAAQPAGTGKTIVVELYTDGTGNYFKPTTIEAHKGDIVRFTLKMGVHNIHFLPDSNPGKTGLPPASDMLQLPDQTYDLPVTFAKGTYYFQCDPHALLGMKGHLKVED